MTLPQMALSWVLRRPPVSAALVGIRKPQELEGNVRAVGLALSPETLSEIESIMVDAIGADTELPV